jgi:hypothetical protein
MAEAIRNSNHGKFQLLGTAIAILAFIPLGLWIAYHPLFLHATYEYQRVIYRIVNIAFGITFGLFLSITMMANYQLKLMLKGLLDVFDPGSTVLGDKFISGSFQGHPAWVSVTSDLLLNRVYICMGGHFFPPFNVQTFRSFRSARIFGVAASAAFLLFWSADTVFFPDHGPASVVPSIAFWNLLILSVWACWLAGLFLSSRRSTKPGVTQIDMQLANDRLTPFETTRPDRFRTALEQQKFREVLAHIFDSCHADGVKAPADGSVGVGAFWSSTVNALRKRALRKETVRETLIELLTLYTAAEQLFPRSV